MRIDEGSREASSVQGKTGTSKNVCIYKSTHVTPSPPRSTSDRIPETRRAVATMYELHFRDTTTPATTAAATNGAAAPPVFTVARMAEAVDLDARLADRERLPPAELDAALAARSDAHSLGREGKHRVFQQLPSLSSAIWGMY